MRWGGRRGGKGGKGGRTGNQFREIIGVDIFIGDGVEEAEEELRGGVSSDLRAGCGAKIGVWDQALGSE